MLKGCLIARPRRRLTSMTGTTVRCRRRQKTSGTEAACLRLTFASSSLTPPFVASSRLPKIRARLPTTCAVLELGGGECEDGEHRLGVDGPMKLSFLITIDMDLKGARPTPTNLLRV